MGYIYILTSPSPSGKSYIGQTIRSIEKRFQEHQNKRGRCVALYRAIRKYGWDNFEKDWYECPDEDLNFDEDLLVREMGTLSPDGYNLKEGGSNGKMSEETTQKMSESQRGEKNHMYGKTLSEKTKQRLREANFGKTHTDETKQKISESQRGDKHHMYGKTHTVETKKKLSDANAGKVLSEETKQKMSEAHLGEKHRLSKRVYQYDLEGNMIESFGSTGEAARHLRRYASKISECAGGKSKTAYGFKWSYIKF